MMKRLSGLALLGSLAMNPAVAEAAPRTRHHFPTAGKDFAEGVEARLAKARARLATWLERKKVDDAKKKEALARFEETANKVRALVAEVGKDDVVTREEAQRVRETMKLARRHARRG